MKLVILTTLFVGTIAVPMFQSVDVKDDGSYRFSFETGKEGGSHSRTEQRDENGVVIGKFSYEDPNGAIREVSYRADDFGYVANGDVGVEGAPKGQFPAPLPEADLSPKMQMEENKENAEESEVHNVSHDGTELKHLNEESIKYEEIPELPGDDSTANDPPEAFPEGYFLNKFHGLRRLPEPTKEESPSTSEPTTEAEDSSQEPDKDGSPTASTSTELTNVPDEELNKINRAPTSEMELFMHLRPFQSFHSPPLASSMLHQPVYVFSYQHPESFGYHYYY